MKRHRIFFFSFSVFLFSLTAGAIFCSGAPRAADLLKRRGFAWKTAQTEHLRLHFESGTLAEKRIEELKTWQEIAFGRNLRLLGGQNYPFQTDVFVVESRGRMKDLIDEEINGVAYGDTNVVCFVYGEKINASGSHELMHVMAANIWGKRPRSWINEGLAVYSDDRWWGFGLHDLSKYLWQEKKLIPLEKLIENFSAHPDLITYPQIGSFVKFLYEEYGVAKVKELWSSGKEKDFARVVGKDLKTLENEWHERLKQADSAKVKYDLPAQK